MGTIGKPQKAHQPGTFRKLGCLFLGGPYNKDPTIWGTMLGSPIFGNPHLCWECVARKILGSGFNTKP